MKIYNYLYYRIYKWNLKTWGEGDGPELNALLGVSLIMFENLLLVVFILRFFGVELFIEGKISVLLGLIVFLVLIVLNYFNFIHKNKYKALVRKLDKDPQNVNITNTIFFWIYVLLSFFLLPIFGLYIL